MDKKVLVTRASLPELSEYVDEIKDIWETHWLTNMGEKHNSFKTELCKYLGVDQIELLTNGHMALELGLQALGLTKGEVITTPFTFASTTHAIVRNGLTPIFCDINSEDYTIDVSKIEELITPKTVAIMPVHVYGNICDVKGIEEIARKYNLKVIYDAAHAFGETYDGRPVGNFGDLSCFSFHATKVFNSIEGGAACFHDTEFGKRLYQLKNFGIKDQETVDGVGANAKMNEFCAAMGLCNLRHVDEEIEKRKKIVEQYNDRLSNINGLKLNRSPDKVKQNYAYYPIVVDEEVLGHSRDDIHRCLLEHGIEARKYFYPLTNEFDCYKGVFSSDNTPVASMVSKRVLTLPLYVGLAEEDVNEICEIITSLSRD